MQLLISVTILNWDKFCCNAHLYELLFTDEISTFLSFACWELTSLFLSTQLHESWRLGKRKIQVNVDSCLPRVKNKQNVSFSASVVNEKNEWFLYVGQLGCCQRYMIHFTKQQCTKCKFVHCVTQIVSCLCLYVHDKESNWVVCVAATFYYSSIAKLKHKVSSCNFSQVSKICFAIMWTNLYTNEKV